MRYHSENYGMLQIFQSVVFLINDWLLRFTSSSKVKSLQILQDFFLRHFFWKKTNFKDLCKEI